ncbi:PQQ-like beta-propeller repeat protein [Alphaproteobacteria bacterium]|nr:PQQ-like beta-propeller repeat protein [Alphaproteobacteria bacterium]
MIFFNSIPNIRKTSLLLAVSAFTLIAGCSSKEEKIDISTEERISVLSYERKLTIDPRVTDTPMVLPPSFENSSWAQPGGYPSHAMYHLSLASEQSELFSVDMVEGSSGNARIITPPIVANDKVFAMGANLDIAAVDANSGEPVWQQSVAPDWKMKNSGLTRFIGMSESRVDNRDGFTGGIAYAEGRIFVATGFGEVLALSAGTGEIIWRVRNVVPFSNAPTVRDGRIYVVSQDSRLQVFSVDDGARLWENLAITEQAGILSASSPAVSDQVVVAGFNSGEVISMRVVNGTQNWSDSLSARSLQVSPMSELTAIVGRPVIDRDRVFAVSHGGRMVSIDVRTGERVWTADIGSIETPWVAGGYVYVISTDAELIALTRNLGRVRWVSNLPGFENEKKRKGRINWTGPIMAGGKLILASSQGDLYFVSPETGEVDRVEELDSGVNVSPVVAKATLYLLTDDGELIAYR